MTTKDEALRLALGCVVNSTEFRIGNPAYEQCEAACREALAQPAGETIVPRAFLERTLSAMEGVIDVADRKTVEFDALRSCVVDLTVLLYANQPAGAREHVTNGSPCWCNPELDYKDPDTGAEVWIHKEPQ